MLCATMSHLPCCRAQWVIQNLAKWCYFAGGVLVVAAIILLVLSVELAADPDQWPEAANSMPALDESARSMLSAGRASEAAAEREPLLKPDVDATGSSAAQPPAGASSSGDQAEGSSAAAAGAGSDAV